MSSDAAAAGDRTYADYLALGQLLSAQHPLSEEHDEHLFITVHQAMELWLAQCVLEVRQVVAQLRADALVPAYKGLARVSRIQAVMTLSWDVLATMTPNDYSTFRGVLGSSSGFQSAGFRVFESLLGVKDPRHLAHHEGDGRELLAAALAAPSLWDEACLALSRAGLLELDADRDWAQPHVPDPAVEAGWLAVYQDTARWWELYQLAEKLVDLDDALAAWRHKHVVTVSRIIGNKSGTGGSAGVRYLEQTVPTRAFPELWSLRTQL